MMNEFTAVYRPGIFDVANLDEAAPIILTANGASTEHRWATETPYFTDPITRTVAPATHGSRPGERSGGGKAS
ncbi:MAG TPA: hypothetical protein VKQ27_12515 [Acetobacteraceae bacterium]|nr:hypothetical protein [Acetobacteraceae bacterium]